MPSRQFPRWIDRSHKNNLREVGENLFVGAEFSPRLSSGRKPWALVVDLYGAPIEEGIERYSLSERTITWPFLDGDRFPEGLLGLVSRAVESCRRQGPVLVHCQAGLSRSASAAYAILRTQDRLSHEEAIERVFVEKGFPRETTIASARAFVQKRKS